MKRLHVHVSVEDISQSVKFYSVLFASEPTVSKSDYAKWMLEDPRVNFAISKRGHAAGIEHLGIQVENEAELGEVYDRLARADRPVIEEAATTCCYANSDKQWITDPQGVAWETFFTRGDSTVYGQERANGEVEKLGATCCEPAAMAKTATQKQDAACCEPTTREVVAKKTGCCGPAAA
jgi:hypothetical protein